jgi:nuclear GTP-binding protein
MSDANEREGAKTASASTQNAAEGILDPRKRKAEKKRRKANKFSVLTDMDADYDFKVDYQMKDALAEEGNDGGDEEPKEADPMTGVDDA